MPDNLLSHSHGKAMPESGILQGMAKCNSKKESQPSPRLHSTFPILEKRPIQNPIAVKLKEESEELRQVEIIGQQIAALPWRVRALPGQWGLIGEL